MSKTVSRSLMFTPHPHPSVSPEVVQLTPLQTLVAVVVLLLVLWIAFRIGVVILRIVAGLLFLGCACYGIWYLFLR